MTLLRTLGACLAGSLLLPGIAAQSFTVGGAGADYPDLVQAIAAVPPGAILSVRPGKYRGFTTGKPLRIRLEFSGAAGSIEPAPGAAYAIVVDGLPPFSTFAMVGADSEVAAGTLGAIRIANTAGSVFVSGLTVTAGTAPAVDVQNAAPVHLHATRLTGTPGLQVQNALVVGNDLRILSPAGSAVAALQATLDLTRGSYAGQDLPALQLVDSTARLAGDGATVIKVSGTTTLPVPAIEAQGGLLAWQPSRFLVVPANGGPDVLTFATTVVADDPPSLTVQGGPPGATGSIRLCSGTALPAFAVVAPFVPPLFFGTSALWIDLGQPYVVALLGVADPQGLSTTFPMPTSPALLGDVSCVQGAVFSAGIPTLSGPAPLITL